MFVTRWQIGRLLGIPISIDLSWLLIAALLSWTLAGAFAAVVPDLPPAMHWAMGVFTALAFFACVVLHEMGHAVAARRLGIPIRGITLFLFGGVAEMGGEPRSPGREFIMAIAAAFEAA